MTSYIPKIKNAFIVKRDGKTLRLQDQKALTVKRAGKEECMVPS